MTALTRVPIAPLPIERFREVLDDDGYRDLLALARRAATLLDGRVVWCVNSTAHGGGVAEMLRSLLAFTRGAGVDTRWLVIDGTPEFFALTKRLHNCLHAAPARWLPARATVPSMRRSPAPLRASSPRWSGPATS